VVFYYKDQHFVLIYKIGKEKVMKKLFLGFILGLGLSIMTFAKLSSRCIRLTRSGAAGI